MKKPYRVVEDLDEQHVCESCLHCRPRTPKDKGPSAGYDLARFWCEKLGIPTHQTSFRCGGDDYSPKA
jgi:hypothetical protein